MRWMRLADRNSKVDRAVGSVCSLLRGASDIHSPCTGSSVAEYLSESLTLVLG